VSNKKIQKQIQPDLFETKPEAKSKRNAFTTKGNKTKDSQQLGDFLKNGKVGWEIFTTRPSNNVHALSQYYKRVTTCTPVKVIEGDTLTPMTRVLILD
jgi:hypothetical protein